MLLWETEPENIFEHWLEKRPQHKLTLWFNLMENIRKVVIKIIWFFLLNLISLNSANFFRGSFQLKIWSKMHWFHKLNLELKVATSNNMRRLFQRIFSSDWPYCSRAPWSSPRIPTTSRFVISAWKAVSKIRKNVNV